MVRLSAINCGTETEPFVREMCFVWHKQAAIWYVSHRYFTCATWSLIFTASDMHKLVQIDAKWKHTHTHTKCSDKNFNWCSISRLGNSIRIEWFTFKMQMIHTICVYDSIAIVTSFWSSAQILPYSNESRYYTFGSLVWFYPDWNLAGNCYRFPF